MLTAAELEAASRPRAKKPAYVGLKKGPQRSGDSAPPQAVGITAKLMMALREPRTLEELVEAAGGASDTTVKRYLIGIEEAVGLVRPARGGDRRTAQRAKYRLP